MCPARFVPPERRVEAFKEAGATWWLEGAGDDEDLPYVRELIPQGPQDV